MNNFEARKRLLDYDDVMNQQREVVYDLRLFALEGGEDLKGEIWEMIEHAVRRMVGEYMKTEDPEGWDLAGLRRRLLLDLFVTVGPLPGEGESERADASEIEEAFVDGTREAFHRKVDSFGEHAERVLSFLMLTTLDDKWKDHLYDLDHLKASIGFRGWGQKDPLVEYKKEAYEMFVSLMDDLRSTLAQNLFKAQITVQQPRVQPAGGLFFSGPSEIPQTSLGGGAVDRATLVGSAAGSTNLDDTGIAQSARSGPPPGLGLPRGGPAPQDVAKLSTNRDEERKVRPVVSTNEPGRNDPCPCGSGKKYKKCHGASPA
jgi:preprotein translocase subunit SecA